MTLAPWKESYNQPRQHIKKQRHNFANKGPSSQSYGFSSSHVWVWELDYIEKTEHQRIDAFELWCWGRLLRVPCTAKRSPVNPKGNQFWIFFGELMVKLQLQYFGHLMQRADSLEKTLMLGKLKTGREGDDRDGWMASPTQWTWVWPSSGRWWRTGKPGVLQSMGLQRVGHDLKTEQELEGFCSPRLKVTKLSGPLFS